jgi:hypothetical protein
MDKYYELSDETITSFKTVYAKKSFAIDIKMKFIGNSKQKSLIKVTKISDQFQFLIKSDILVSINEELFDKFTDDIMIEILFAQEIDKLSINMDSGAIKMVKPDLNTFSGIVNKYGIENVSRANQVVDIASEQDADLI